MNRQFDAVIAGPKLLMHNVRLSDPLDPFAKALKALTANRKKSDADHMRISEVEFEGGLYFDAELGPYIPDSWLNSMLVEGARRQKLGRVFEANVSVVDEKHPLQYSGPRTLKGLLAAPRKCVDRRSVVIGQAKTMRTRPSFRDWKVKFSVQLLECELNGDDVETALLNAGPYGIGDGRPMYGGKFTLESFKETK